MVHPLQLMVACSSRSMAGSAVAEMVGSTEAMNRPMETMAKTSLRRSSGSASRLAVASFCVALTYHNVSCLPASIQVVRENVMDAELVARLRGVIPRLARQLNETSTGEGLTPTQYSVLALVRVRGPLGLAELTELEGLNPTMLSRIVKVLDELGLIRRLPDPSDMRAARLGGPPDREQGYAQV